MKTLDKQALLSRREFFRDTARFVALGAFLGGGAILTFGRRGATCVRTTPCEACALLGRCQLPQADAARLKQAGATEGDHV